MAIYEGDCKMCGRLNVDIMDSTQECLSCSRIRKLEKEIENLKHKLNNNISPY